MYTCQIEEKSHHNAELQEVCKCIETGNWGNPQCTRYIPMCSELCTIGKIIMRGTKIVITTLLRREVIAIAHERHVEISGTKLRLKNKSLVAWARKRSREIFLSVQRIPVNHSVTPSELVTLTELQPGQ